MIINLSILFILIKLTYCKISITNYPTVDLLENSPLNTFVVSLSRLTNLTNSTKLVLLNLNGYETTMFSIINGSIYTINSIDREEFIEKQYCLDNLYCKIEIHILVNDGNGYWIIPIHIIDENDNEPKFREKEIELKYRENILNGYQIPFEGAKDLDEGKNSEIEYILDCSNNFNENFLFNFNQTTKTCYSLFELIILSQSISTYDRLALKFLPSSSSGVNIENEYKLKVYALDKKKKKKNIKQDGSMLKLNIQVEQKERITKFSLSNYEFVVLLNSSSLNEKSKIKIGRVYAIPNNSFERIYYQLIQKNQNNIEINSLTGELNFIFNQNLFQTEITFDVQASILKRNSSKMLITQTKVKVFIRYLNQLNNISFQFRINSTKNEILQINNSNCFFVDQNIEINENLFEIILQSFSYPFDQFILSLQNYLNLFSLSSSSSQNIFILKIKQQLHSTSIYMLNISVKHKLTQQWLPNLTIELIVIDQWTTSTTMTRKYEITTISMRKSTNMEIQSREFCQKNQNYTLYKLNKTKKKRIGLLKVIKSNSIIKTNEKMNLFISLNKSEIILDGCRMSFDQLNKNNSLNKSYQYQLCLSSYSNQCYNLTIKDQIMSKNILNNNSKLFLSMKLVELIMLIVSLVFVLITILLILLICRLKDIDICLKWKNSFIYRNKYGLTNVQQQFSSTKIKERVHSIVSGESRSPSFQSVRIKNDPFNCNIDDYDQREALPSANMFVLSSSIRQSFAPSFTYSFQQKQEIIQSNQQDLKTTPQRTSSSSSFLQETKQLLDMISNTTTNQHLDLSKLTSEV